MEFYWFFPKNQTLTMKNILFLNTVYRGGGASNVARDLFLKSFNEGYNSFFAFGRGRDEGEGLFNFGNKFEFLIHVFLVRFLGLEGYGSFFATRKLIKFIKEKKINLIHIHNLHGYYVNFFMLLNFLNKEKIPIVWTLHDEWAVTWLPAHSMGCQHCKTLQGICVNKYNYPKNYFPLFKRLLLEKKRKVFSSLSKITIVSPAHWLLESLTKSFLVNKNMLVIENGVDINVFKPIYNKLDLRKKYNLPNNKRIVTFFCVNPKDANKGFKYILEIARMFENRNIIFLGIGNNHVADTNIIFLEKTINSSNIAQFLNVSDIFILPSSVETQPLSVLEALACDIPVVAFDISATKELEEYITLASVKNSQDLNSKLQHVLNKLPEKKNNHRKFISQYSINNLKKYFYLYKNLLS